MAEMTEVSEPALGAGKRADRAPELAALGSFAAVMLVGVGLVLIKFQVPGAIAKAAPWVIGAALLLYLRFGAPSSSLAPTRRAQRDERRNGVIVGALSAGVLLGGLTAATFLTTWSQWLVLGSYLWITIGVFVMLHVRFTIGS